MSREWVDDLKPPPRRGPDKRDKRWVMRCDCYHQDHGYAVGLHRCPTEGEPSREMPALEQYAADGWFIAEVHGDRCPHCIAAGHGTKP